MGLMEEAGPLVSDIMQPQPRNFFDDKTMQLKTPFKLHNVQITGLDGTSMYSFRDILSQDEMWELSFYISSMRHLEKLSSLKKDKLSLLTSISENNSYRKAFYKNGLPRAA